MMLSLPTLTDEAIAARPYFENLSPGMGKLFTGKVGKWLARGFAARGLGKMIKSVFIDQNKTIEEATGDLIVDRITKKMTSPLSKKITKTHRHINHVSKTKDFWRKNGLGGRVWPMEGSVEPEQLIVVFHDANRAGPHIDVHIGRFSLVRRVKPEVYEQLRFNNEGYLTQDSQDLLLDFLRDEISNRSRIPQNLDHTLSNAKAQWTHRVVDDVVVPQQVANQAQDAMSWVVEGHLNVTDKRSNLVFKIIDGEPLSSDEIKYIENYYEDRDKPDTSDDHAHAEFAEYNLFGGDLFLEWIQDRRTGQLHKWEDDPWWSELPVANRFHHPAYGSASIRQVIVDDEAVVYKAHTNQDGGHFEFYAPAIEPDRGLYVHQLYSGSETRAPIAVWGKLTHNPPALLERLHLKGHHPKDLERMVDKSDMSTSTAKYDGSSCYVVVSKKGTTIWSPRKSVVTGNQIEYTYMIPELANLTSEDGQTIIAMGELLFRPKPNAFQRLVAPFTPHTNDYLPQALGSGILNSHAIRPTDVVPEIRLYRFDKISNKEFDDLDFWSNRDLQAQLAKMDDSKTLRVVQLMQPDDAYDAGFEGVVTAPVGESVNEGFKLKWWRDPSDWVVESVDLHDGPKGGIAGVVRFTSLESGRKYNLGPGQMGDHDFNKRMMEDPDRFIGRVARVNSKQGHEGRAASFIDWHDDKGLGDKHYELDPKNPYYYRDEQGQDLFRVRRSGGRFLQEHPTEHGWYLGRNNTPNVLYKLPELLQNDDQTVYITEGEKDVNTLTEAGLVATTNPQGAGKWQDDFSEHLQDKEVVILPDNDGVGHRHANQVAKSVADHAKSVKIVHLPGVAQKQDISDWLEQGNTINDLQKLVDKSPEVCP